jgi:hypothetical protein
LGYSILFVENRLAKCGLDVEIILYRASSKEILGDSSVYWDINIDGKRTEGYTTCQSPL